MPIKKGQVQLESLAAWERLAGPKRASQWVDGRSAKEAARAWLEGGGVRLPVEVAGALSAHAAFGVVGNWQAEPEARLCFDTFAGEPRNSDLAVDATDDHGEFLIAVEAKSDEPFGETINETLAAARGRAMENPRSNGVTRVHQLTQALFGQDTGPPTGELRYQLLTACAGAICEAERRRYSRALFLVHEFVSDKTRDERHQRNAADLNRFVQRLSNGVVNEIRAGQICGPFTVPGAPLIKGGVQLFVGKVRRNLREKAQDQ